MLNQDKIAQIAHRVAAAHLGGAIDDVMSAPTTDSQGRDALRITIVIKSGSAAKLGGNAILDTLVQIQEELRESGEDRFPIVEYATQEELQDSGDS